MHYGIADSTEESEEGFSYSYIMSLNIIIDLCRLLSRGYYHLYHVLTVLNPLENVSIPFQSSSYIPLSLYEQIAQQYDEYIHNASLENDSSSSFYYMRYLQSFQKLVYLVIIDDYLSLNPSISFEQWIENRPEIRNILNSLNHPSTKVFASPSTFNESPMNPEEVSLEDDEITLTAEKTKEILISRDSFENETPFIYRHINGLVLNLNSIIKDDYFPGSRNIHLVFNEDDHYIGSSVGWCPEFPR